VSVQVPGARLINIYNNQFARSLDGYLAVAFSAYTADSRAGSFIAVISPDGAKQVVVRTNPFVPQAVACAADGAIWAAGYETENGQEVERDYFLIRRFDRTGRLLGGILSRGRFSGRTHPATRCSLVASNDRVGWFSEDGGKYIEFALDGKELAVYEHEMRKTGDKFASYVDGVALCDDNSVWVSVETQDHVQRAQSWRLVALDRTHGTWSSGKAQSTALWLYGCAGNRLAAFGGDIKVIEWFAID